MRYYSLFILCMVCCLTINAHNKFCIKPKNYNEIFNNSDRVSNQLSPINSISGSFRLKEYSSIEQKIIETDIVTFFIGKNHESEITFSVNCAKQINLHYVIVDSKGKHKTPIKPTEQYYRFSKNIDISKFKEGACTISVYNNNQLIHTIEFEKAFL